MKSIQKPGQAWACPVPASLNQQPATLSTYHPPVCALLACPFCIKSTLSQPHLTLSLSQAPPPRSTAWIDQQGSFRAQNAAGFGRQLNQAMVASNFSWIMIHHANAIIYVHICPRADQPLHWSFNASPQPKHTIPSTFCMLEPNCLVHNNQSSPRKLFQS